MNDFCLFGKGPRKAKWWALRRNSGYRAIMKMYGRKRAARIVENERSAGAGSFKVQELSWAREGG